MQADLILVEEYCRTTKLEPVFFMMLEEIGLIDIRIIDGGNYLLSSQLSDIEKYARMHYELAINIEGIDAIHHLLKRMECLQSRLDYLSSKLALYESAEADENDYNP